jgi:hypothetical protein
MYSCCSCSQLTQRILEAYQNVAQLSWNDALLRFLQIWQALPDFGLSYVVVRYYSSGSFCFSPRTFGICVLYWVNWIHFSAV